MTGTVMTENQETTNDAKGAQDRLRKKNLALLAVLVAWAVLLYAVAILRMGGAS